MTIITLLAGIKLALTYRVLNRAIKATSILGGSIEALRWEWKKMVGVFAFSFQNLSDEESKKRRLEANEILNKIEGLHSLINIELAKLNVLYMDKQ